VPPERTLNAAVCPEILSWICVAKHRPVTGLGGTSKGRFGVYGKFLGGTLRICSSFSLAWISALLTWGWKVVREIFPCPQFVSSPWVFSMQYLTNFSERDWGFRRGSLSALFLGIESPH